MTDSSETIGVRELKAHLSRHLKRVRSGVRLLVTDRGRVVASINPVEHVEESRELEWARRMVADGRAQWSGGKPNGAPRRITLTSGRSLSDAVVEDRR